MNTKPALILAIGFIIGFVAFGLLVRRDGEGELVSGKLVSVTIWKNPIASSSNEGSTYDEGKVHVYSEFIVVALPNGQKIVCRNAFWSGLVLR